MLPKKIRITEKFDYNKVKKFGKPVYSPLFILSFCKDLKNSNAENRFGIIVTNKVDKRAVERHRLKRIIHDLINQNLEKFGKGNLIVFVINGSMANKKYEDISAEFNKTLSKVSFT